MVVEVFFTNNNGIFENPRPSISDGAEVILLQRGEALVGRWDAEIGGFIHPSNQKALEQESLEAIIKTYPEVDLISNEIRIFRCPESIANKFDWDWEK